MPSRWTGNARFDVVRFQQSCQTQEIGRNSKPLLLMGSPIDFGGEDKEQARAVLHLAFISELYEIQVRKGRYFLRIPQAAGSNQQWWTSRTGSQIGVDELGCLTQALSTPTHLPSMVPDDHEGYVPAIAVTCVSLHRQQPQHPPPLPKLDVLAVDADEEPQVEWEAEDDVKGGPLDPPEVKTARQKETQNLWDREVCEYATEAEARARTGRDPVGLKWIDTNKRRPKSHVPLAYGVYGGAPQKGSNRSCQQHHPWELCEFYSVWGVRKTFFALKTRCDERGPQGKGARCKWKTTTDDVRILGCCSTVGRALRPGPESGRNFPRRGFSVPFLP